MSTFPRHRASKYHRFQICGLAEGTGLEPVPRINEEWISNPPQYQLCLTLHIKCSLRKLHLAIMLLPAIHCSERYFHLYPPAVFLFPLQTSVICFPVGYFFSASPTDKNTSIVSFVSLSIQITAL